MECNFYDGEEEKKILDSFHSILDGEMRLSE